MRQYGTSLGLVNAPYNLQPTAYLSMEDDFEQFVMKVIARDNVIETVILK